MKIYGLTGSIGMGKSAVAAMLRREGVPVFDADAEVHRLQGPGGALVPAIEERFPGTTGPDGVDREKLGAAVFGNKGELQALEQIVHPAVRNARENFLRKHRRSEEHTSELQSLMRNSYAVFCLTKKISRK